MRTKNSLIRIYVVGALVILLAAAGIFFAGLPNVGKRSYAVMLTSVAVVTFCGFLKLDERSRVEERTMRTAVAASFFLTYIVLLGTVVFWAEISEDEGRILPELSRTMLNHFTTIMGIVVAFYFGSSAYTEVKRKQREDSTSDSQSEREK